MGSVTASDHLPHLLCEGVMATPLPEIPQTANNVLALEAHTALAGALGQGGSSYTDHKPLPLLPCVPLGAT